MKPKGIKVESVLCWVRFPCVVCGEPIRTMGSARVVNGRVKDPCLNEEFSTPMKNRVRCSACLKQAAARERQDEKEAAKKNALKLTPAQIDDALRLLEGMDDPQGPDLKITGEKDR